MNNQITIKNIPASIVYYSQTTLKKREEILSWIPEVGKACKELNPSLKCTEPYYGFCEYLDGEYKEELRDVSLHWVGSSNQRVIDIKKSIEQKRITTIE